MLFRLLWWTRCAVIEALRRWFAPRFREIAEPALSPEEVYIAERAKRLVASFEKKDCQFKMNANMTSEFYRRDGFKYCLPHRPNDGKVAKLKISDSPFEVDSSPSSGSVHSAWTIEKMWIARVLVENTPRGNVYMHYNIYKGAFAYYCDTSLPYALANAAAARYVLTFACRDLYLDESVLGAERRSPLIALAASAEAAARGASRAALLLPDRKSGATSAAPLPFAKLKKYGAHGAPTAGAAAAPSEPAVELARNKFVYMGRVRDMKVLQTPKKTATVDRCEEIAWSNRLASLNNAIKNKNSSAIDYKGYVNQKNAVEEKLAEFAAAKTVFSKFSDTANNLGKSVATSALALERKIETYLSVHGIVDDSGDGFYAADFGRQVSFNSPKFFSPAMREFD